MNSFVHILFAIVVAGLAGAVWAGIAGILKATVGAHEVITTIMLNWIAYYLGLYLFSQGGPLQNTEQVFSPTSNEVVEGAKLPSSGGTRFSKVFTSASSSPSLRSSPSG